MKTLVVYYSRTGVTRRVAEEMKRALLADAEEIRDVKSRGGVFGWLGAGRDATLRRETPIAPTSLSPAGYDLVIVGTPVWAFTMASPVRTWLARHGRDIRQVAFFCTMGGQGDDRTFAHMEELCGRRPLATLSLIDKDVRKGAHVEKLHAFVETLTRPPAQ